MTHDGVGIPNVFDRWPPSVVSREDVGIAAPLLERRSGSPSELRKLVGNEPGKENGGC